MPDSCLYYDEPRRLLFCKICQRVITPTSLTHHLSAPIHKGLTQPERETLRLRFSTVSSISIKGLHYDAIQQLFKHGPFPYLSIQPGWTCLTCHVAAVEQSTISQHHCTGEAQLSKDCFVSRFAGNTSYFTVPREFVPRPVSEIVSCTWDGAIRLHDRLLSQTQQRTQQVVVSNEVGHRPLWDKRTGWLEWFAHVNMADLVPLCSLKTEPEDPLETLVQPLREAISTTFMAWHRLVDRDDQDLFSGNLLLRILQSIDKDTYQEPFEPLSHPQSLYAYINTFHRVILFILRAALLPDDRRFTFKLPLTPAQIRLATLVVDSARSLFTSDRPLVLGPQLLELSRSLIEQELDCGPRRSPVLFCLGIIAWDPQAARWSAPNAHSQRLSHLIYIIRIVALHHVTSHVPAGESRTEALRTYCRTYLRVGRPYIFDEFHNQRNLALNLAPDCYGRPTVFWEDGYETLVVKGQRVLRSRVGEWVNSLITEARDILSTELLFAQTTYVLSLDIQDYPDQLAYANHRGSIVDLHPSLQGGVRRVATRLESYHPTSPFAHVHQLGPEGKKHAREVYEAAIRRFLYILAILHITCGGAPPRGTEVTRLGWCNAQSRFRSWYFVDGLLCAVYDYNKSEANSGKPKVLPRFYPTSIAQLVLAYVSEVLPFHSFLVGTHKADDLPLTLTPLIWHDGSVPWDSDIISQEMARRSLTAVGTELNISTWRHFSIAIIRALVEQETTSTNRALAQSFALQAGHSLELEDHHYALTFDDIVGLSTRTLKLFQANSECWHRVLGCGTARTLPSSSSASSPIHESITALRHEVSELSSVVRNIRPLKRSRSPSLDAISSPPRRPRLLSPPPPSCEPPTGPQLDAHFQARYGPQFAFREAQRLAIDTLLSRDCPRNLMVHLPTGGGKTLLIEASAHFHRGEATIVVVPYISLKEDLLRRLNQVGVSARSFDDVQHNMTYHSVIVVVMESTTTNVFHSFMQHLSARHLVARTFWDEAHLIVLESEADFRPWREAIRQWPTREPRVFLSATLPHEVRRQLEDLASLEPHSVRTISASTNVPNRRLEVAQHAIGGGVSLLRTLIRTALAQGQKILVFVRYTSDGDMLSEQCQWPFYSSKVSRTSEGRDILRTFVTASHPTILIATTAASHGLDTVVDLVVIWKMPFSLITAMQQAGRVGRQPQRPGKCLFLLDRPPSPPSKESSKLGYPALYEFLTTTLCRRHVLAKYFDGDFGYFCRGLDIYCDLCQTPPLSRSVAPSVPPTSSLARAFANTLNDSSLETGSTIASDATPPTLPSPQVISESPCRGCSTGRRLGNYIPCSTCSEVPPSHAEPSFSELSDSLEYPSIPSSSFLRALPSPIGLHPSSGPVLPRVGPSSSPTAPVLHPKDLWSVTNLAKIRAARPQTPRHVFTATMAQIELDLGVRCHLCWFARRSGFQSHWFRECDLFQQLVHVHLAESKALRKGVLDRAGSFATKDMHYHCNFPIKGFHPGEFKNPCFRAGLLWAIVEWALPQSLYASVFHQYGLTAYSSVDELARIVLVWEKQTLRLWCLVHDLCQHRIASLSH